MTAVPCGVMPEGHTIHRIARRHTEVFGGRSIAVSSPQGRFAVDAAHLDGRQLARVDAYGKHMFYTWDPGAVLHVHLGLIGRFSTFAADVPEPTPGTRLALRTPDAAAYLSGPMTCRLVDPAEMESIVTGLGPDPLREPTALGRFAANLERRRMAVGATLLDQTVIAGIGNVFRSEILFLCGINPHLPANCLAPHQVQCIWRTAVTELRRGLRSGSIVTVDPAEVGATRRSRLGDDERRYVYQRDGMECLRCVTLVAMAEVAGRRLWWCPGCQPGDRDTGE